MFKYKMFPFCQLTQKGQNYVYYILSFCCCKHRQAWYLNRTKHFQTVSKCIWINKCLKWETIALCWTVPSSSWWWYSDLAHVYPVIAICTHTAVDKRWATFDYFWYDSFITVLLKLNWVSGYITTPSTKGNMFCPHWSKRHDVHAILLTSKNLCAFSTSRSIFI